MRPFFERMDDQFRPATLAESRYLVGMRLHSLIFACQMGIPFVSLSYQPKNAAFCADVGMEAVSVSPYDRHQLDRALTEMLGDAETMRRQLIAFRNQSVQAIWRAVEPLVQRIRRRGRSFPVRVA
jgi:polysaccharide pyruvyl transferase WcaK-like protein